MEPAADVQKAYQPPFSRRTAGLILASPLTLPFLCAASWLPHSFFSGIQSSELTAGLNALL